MFPSLVDWSQFQGIARFQKDLYIGQIGKPCIRRIHSSDSPDRWGSLIGQSNGKPDYWLLRHHLMLACLWDEKWIAIYICSQCLWRSTSFRENWKWLSLHSHMEFQSFHVCCPVNLVRTCFPKAGIKLLNYPTFWQMSSEQNYVQKITLRHNWFSVKDSRPFFFSI